MAATRRRLILEAIRTRLQAIDGSGDFETSSGQQVYFGEAPDLGPDDPAEAIALVVGEETQTWALEGLAYHIQLPIAVQALAKADLDEPWVALEALIGDIKRAVELEDRTLGGLLFYPFERGSVFSLPREDGATAVGAAVSYLLRYKEGWGNP